MASQQRTRAVTTSSRYSPPKYHAFRPVSALALLDAEMLLDDEGNAVVAGDDQVSEDGTGKEHEGWCRIFSKLSSGKPISFEMPCDTPNLDTLKLILVDKDPDLKGKFDLSQMEVRIIPPRGAGPGLGRSHNKDVFEYCAAISFDKTKSPPKCSRGGSRRMNASPTPSFSNTLGGLSSSSSSNDPETAVLDHVSCGGWSTYFKQEYASPTA